MTRLWKIRDGIRYWINRLAVGDVRRGDLERGDVPGWVLVTVMSAGLVVAIFAVFKGKIVGAVTHAIDNVTSGTGDN